MDSNTREESDSLGIVEVPSNVLWGAQTQRSLKHFSIGRDFMHPRLIHAYALLKKSCCVVNLNNRLLTDEQARYIIQGIDKLLSKDPKDHSSSFPLKVWQTGSGTQTNMNVNEVIANLANSIANKPLGSKHPIHPNDHVNLSQSSNDTFPSAMHIALVQHLHEDFFPSLRHMIEALKHKSDVFSHIVKIGRTHMQDAVPVTLGSVFSGYHAQLIMCEQQLQSCVSQLLQLAIGATAVGSGLNAPDNFSHHVCEKLSEMTKYAFVPADNTYQALSAHNACVTLSSHLKNLAASLYKIANDIRLLASGPRCGIGELILPSNEPGSSIMPGKVNPTQCESLCMVAIQVYACDHAVSFAASQGHFELNVNKPIISYNLHQALDLLSDAMQCFTDYCLAGLQANEKKITDHLNNSLMLVTALTPIIGYDKSSKIATYAYENNITLREACKALNYLSLEAFDNTVRPDKMA